MLALAMGILAAISGGLTVTPSMAAELSGDARSSFRCWGQVGTPEDYRAPNGQWRVRIRYDWDCNQRHSASATTHKGSVGTVVGRTLVSGVMGGHGWTGHECRGPGRYRGILLASNANGSRYAFGPWRYLRCGG